jgi:pantoate kinase
VGAGIVLERGVEALATWTPDGPRRVRVRWEGAGELPISSEVARRLSADAGGTVEVELTHGLPIGQGFGMSAAGALATALSVSSALGVPRQRAIEVAHLADLFGGGGLGGVSAILGGGLEVRARAGIPPYGQVLHRAFGPSVVLAVTGGPVPSPPLLGDPKFLARVADSAEEGLDSLKRDASVEGFLVASERFTDRLRLAAPLLRKAIRSLRSKHVGAAQAMFGRSLFAVALTPTGRVRLLRALEKTGWPAVELRASARGAVGRALP